VTPTATEADALSTAVLVAGLEVLREEGLSALLAIKEESTSIETSLLGNAFSIL
jgi:thiamine biosynthesis lipoprotein ApbE